MEKTKLKKYTVYYPNSSEYHTLKREIWGQDSYHFDSNAEVPYIIDIGAHIGLSVLYFKDLYPNSEIVAFEPQIESFKILEQNIEENALEKITLINKAVWKEDGKKNFYIDSTDSQWYSNASFLENSWNHNEKTKKVIVETTRLDKYLNKDIDCLKIDTEGSELAILKSIRSYLHKIKDIVIEYHPIKDSSPDDILNLLKKNFDTSVYLEGKYLKTIPKNKLLSIRGTQR